jgi:F0F1-type ATP synthase membrane subunit c/vacuolar-type H+-ATPase subunit K
MSGIIAVYGLVIAVLIAGDMAPPPTQNMSLYTGFMHLASGLSVGLAGVAAGYTIGIVGDAVSDLATMLVSDFDANIFLRVFVLTCSSPESTSG